MAAMAHQFRMVALAFGMILAANADGPIYTVRTSAMEPTFLVGDHVLAPGGEPISDLRRGDVIVFHFPPDPKVVLVKRLIGLPGDHVPYQEWCPGFEFQNSIRVLCSAFGRCECFTILEQFPFIR